MAECISSHSQRFELFQQFNLRFKDFTWKTAIQYAIRFENFAIQFEK